MTGAGLLIDLAGWWLIAGAVIALPFLTVGIDRIDPDARGAYAFRPLLVPAVLLIWPLVLWRWWRLETGAGALHDRYRPPRRAHLPAATAMAAAIVLLVAGGLAARQDWPADIAPERLSEARP